MSWYTESGLESEIDALRSESSFGSDYGIEKASSDKTPIIVSIIGLVAVGSLSYAAYKMVSHIGDEQKRLTPGFRGY